MTAGLPFAGVTRCAHRAEEPPRGLPTGPGTEGRAVGGAGHLGRTPPATSAREGHGGCPGGVRARAFAGRLGARNPSSLRGRRAEGAGARTGARARACASVCTSVCVRVCVAVNGPVVCECGACARRGAESPHSRAALGGPGPRRRGAGPAPPPSCPERAASAGTRLGSDTPAAVSPSSPLSVPPASGVGHPRLWVHELGGAAWPCVRGDPGAPQPAARCDFLNSVWKSLFQELNSPDPRALAG